jgi:membrane-associated phospholipid phosphatase
MKDVLVKAKPYHRWFMLIALILSGLWFIVLEKNIVTPEYQLYSRFDDYIPYAPIFVIPYVFWYLYVAAPAFFLFFKAPREFVRMALFLTVGMIIACMVYTFFPNGQALRPVLRNYDEPLIKLIRFIYSKDTPANCAPSIHVIYSVAAHAAISLYDNNGKRIVWIKALSLIIALLCIMSTVFIKQHSIIDLMFGLFISALLYFAIYGYKCQL